ncbi:MAG: 4Fe-4S binding protein, partial [bacterium]
FAGREIPQHLGTPEIKQKRILISAFCAGCGSCVKACPNGALSLQEGKAVVDHSKCILCGYCNPVCPDFAIRLI